MEAQGSIEMRLKAIRGHRRIMKCLKARDGAAIERAIRVHLEDPGQDIRPIALGVAPRNAHLQRGK